MPHVRNPAEWATDQLKDVVLYLGSVGRSIGGTDTRARSRLPTVRPIEIADLREVLAKGLNDFGACRTDVIFLCLFYPIMGLVLARLVLHQDMVPLLFPIASGFALLGPVAAVGLYEMSRQREQGVEASWAHAFGTMRSPSFGTILVLGFILFAIFLAWMVAAQMIYSITLGPAPPVSVTAFLRDVFTTGAGWAMIVVGIGVGFLFAVLVLALSVMSFPMLLDADVGLGIAMSTSIRAVARNPRTMAAWGVIVAGSLVIGALPLFLGLIVVLPVLGHATWHLYRKVVAW